MRAPQRWSAFLPEVRTADAVVVGVLLVLVAIATLSVAAQAAPGEVPVVALLVVGAVQTLPVLWRRERPIGALVVYAASTLPAVLIAGATVTTYTWAVLVFAVVRRSRPLSGGVALVATSLAIPVLEGLLLRPDDAATALGLAAGLALSVVPVLGVAAVLAVVARLRAQRLAARRRQEERDRLADALAEQRDRLAGDLRGLVAVRVEHVVARTRALAAADPSGPDLADRLTATAGEARAALAGMRRALGLLRSEDGPAVPVPRPEAEKPSAWRPTRGGLVLAAVVAAAVAVLAVLADLAAPHLEPGPAADLVGMLDVDLGRPLALIPLAVQVLAVAWWRRAPLPALVVATAGSTAASALGSTHLVTEGAWSILVYGAGLGAALVPSAVTVAASTAVVLVTTLTIADLPATLVASRTSWALSYALVPAVWGLGVLHRRYAQADAHRAQAAEVASAERAVRAQRLGLARELHDVLAHELSALVVTLNAARIAPDAAALATIGETGERIASALPPLLAGVVPAEGAGLDAAVVEALTAPVREAGLPVTVEVVGAAPAASRPEADVFAARIVTEALTNALRHAGPSPTRVTVHHDEDAIAVEVVDAGVCPGHRASREGSGLGLVGMRERAALVGGSVEAGPAGDGWRVAARLPRREAGLLLEEESRGAESASRRTISAPAST